MPSIDSSAPDAPLPDESQLLSARRKAIFGGPGTGPRWALALSGGGIRSATFSLGVLQAVAETRLPSAAPTATTTEAVAAPVPGFRGSLLSRFDYLSTVSGGGYVGAFMCSLFQPQRLRQASASPQAAADDATAALAIGTPGRIRSAAYTPQNMLGAPLAWLRENGRYLVPTGIGDAVYAAALGLRGWVALHVVIGTLLVFLFALGLLGRALLPAFAQELDQALLAQALAGSGVGRIWWSPLFVLALLPALLAVLPLGVSYWLSYRRRDGTGSPLNVAVVVMLLCAAALLLMAWQGDPAGTKLAAPWLPAWTLRSLVWAGLGGIAALGVVYYMACALFVTKIVAAQRTQLTQWLGGALLLTMALVALALLDTAGQTLYLLAAAGGVGAKAAAAPTLLGVLVWLVKKGAGFVGAPAKQSWVTRLPLMTLAGLLGVLLAAAIASLWSLAVVALVWAGAVPAVDQLHGAPQTTFLVLLVLLSLVMAALTGQFPAFINLSSLQTFYSARLTRAYLGASNGQRFTGDPKNRSVAEPLPGDNVELGNFYAPAAAAAAARLTTWSPLHIINVTLNKTVDPAEQLVQRDRKGQPLAVLPYGFAVDGRRLPFKQPTGHTSEIELPLNVGQWIGTSGAAFSTGIGRETTLGMSLLMGVANVRLGTWWQSGHGKWPAPSGLQVVSSALGAVFRTQAYLSYEFRARFFGMNRRWQYLSDGGHFENTAIYELLRDERQVELVVGCDCGADPLYRFDDLANLIRLVRIDLDVDLQVVEDFALAPGLKRLFGAPADFKIPTAQLADGAAMPCALLLKAVRRSGVPTWIVLLKPALHRAAPADVLQYAAQHANFPQEPTTDQFFDEAQWESYRMLGHFIASQMLTADVRRQLGLVTGISIH